MPEAETSHPKKLTPSDVLKSEAPLVLTATLEPVVGDRFQPAGFPEIGHVIYKAPRKDGSTESVCIVDSAASMANHLESVCQRGAHDLDLVSELQGMPYLRCVTGDLKGKRLPSEGREVVVTSLTEGHRIASNYFFGVRKNRKWDGKSARRVGSGHSIADESFGDELAGPTRFGIQSDGQSIAHPPPHRWWNVFKTIFQFDPNSLVHGVLFTEWQIKIPRALTAHLEAFGAGRVDRSGVKFDHLGKTTSGQPIFAVDDATAESIRATFVLDVSLIRSFGRKSRDGAEETQLGLSDKQKEFVVALALWKIGKLLDSPFRFRSGCHLRRTSLKSAAQSLEGPEKDVELDVDIRTAITSADFRSKENGEPELPIVTDVYWPREELYREAPADSTESAEEDDGSKETE
ncbi:MAG: type I-U CRISPR-associated protein Cas7 [Proteobacteria bacterium]|nr:type I-U CRISPR-associated protein Cas7 [Pseudomonadota bacterium]